MTKEEKQAELKANLPHFHGTENWYRHPLNQRVLHTDGAQFVAESDGTNLTIMLPSER